MFATSLVLRTTVVLILVSADFTPSISRVAESPASTQNILMLIERIKIAQVNTPSRDLLATQLAVLIRQTARSRHASSITKHVVGELEDLLRERDVRSWAATSLGYIGRKAKSAAPALEQALADELRLEQGDRTRIVIEPEVPGVNSLCLALRKVGDKMPNACKRL